MKEAKEIKRDFNSYGKHIHIEIVSNKSSLENVNHTLFNYEH